MKTLAIGDQHTLIYQVTEEKTVPYLYPETHFFSEMPGIFATGYMIGLMEWCCMEALRPTLNEGEGCLGTSIDITHVAATLPGMMVTVHATVKEINGRNIKWDVQAFDNLDLIGEGVIGRNVVEWSRFNQGLLRKIEKFKGYD